jgi:plasmid stability protein
MAQVLIRNLDDETVARLKRKAERAGLSLEAFLRQMLSQEAPSRATAIAEIEALRAKIAPPAADEHRAEDLVHELRRARSATLAREE